MVGGIQVVVVEKVWIMKELFIVIAIVVIASEIVRTYNSIEEPFASRQLRIASVVFPEPK